MTALLVSVAAAVVSNPASADKLADKRAQAAQLARQIQANEDRMSALDEQLNNANLRIATLHQQIATAQAAVRSADAVTARLHANLEARAAALYRQGGAAIANGATTSQASSAAAIYSQSLSDRDQQIISSYKRARQEQTIRQHDLENAQRAAQAQQRAILDARRQLTAADAREQHLLAQTQGEIKTLYAEAQAALARAQAEAAKRRMEQQAARDAARRAAQSGGGSGIAQPPMHVVAPNSRAQVAVDAALSKRGDWYQYAAAGPDKFDCSGLTSWAWAQAGVSIPHSSQAQYASLPHLSISQVQPGDLVFFGSPIHHVGMVVGPGVMVEAPHTGAQVRTASYYRPDFAGAARVP